MAERHDDAHYLRGLAARLRSLATVEPYIADQLQQIAAEAEARAETLEAGQQARHRF